MVVQYRVAPGNDGNNRPRTPPGGTGRTIIDEEGQQRRGFRGADTGQRFLKWWGAKRAQRKG